jgi:hypothetical protein
VKFLSIYLPRFLFFVSFHLGFSIVYGCDCFKSREVDSGSHGSSFLMWILFLGDETIWMYAVLPAFWRCLLSPSSR